MALLYLGISNSKGTVEPGKVNTNLIETSIGLSVVTVVGVELKVSEMKSGSLGFIFPTG